MNPNIIKIIGMQKPYIFKGAASCMQNKRVFHSKVALRMENLIPKIFIKKKKYREC